MNAPDSTPLLFDRSKPEDRERMESLTREGARVSDTYRSQLTELYAIEHPDIALTPAFAEEAEAALRAREEESPLEEQGTWAYFPWLSSLVHILPDADFQKVRTARNRNLITEEEQRKFYDATIGIAGLSVGNSVALAIALQGGARHMKLADHDTLELSNLNRIRAGIDMLGLPKVEITARQIYLLNPYAELELFPEGLTESNVGPFLEGCDVMMDEFDHFPMKRLLRDEAKKRRIPIVMAADNADAGVVDIERYDIEPDLEPFHGRVRMSYEELTKLDKKGIGKAIAEMIGMENHTERMLSSLAELGKSLVSWPQLGGTALLNGAAAAYCARQIAIGGSLTDNRAILSLEESLRSKK
jgi:molybdopterin/thiamine biosynthesis adenylyltransferase